MSHDLSCRAAVHDQVSIAKLSSSVVLAIIWSIDTSAVKMVRAFGITNLTIVTHWLLYHNVLFASSMLPSIQQPFPLVENLPELILPWHWNSCTDYHSTPVFITEWQRLSLNQWTQSQHHPVLWTSSLRTTSDTQDPPLPEHFLSQEPTRKSETVLLLHAALDFATYSPLSSVKQTLWHVSNLVWKVPVNI